MKILSSSLYRSSSGSDESDVGWMERSGTAFIINSIAFVVTLSSSSSLQLVMNMRSALRFVERPN